MVEVVAVETKEQPAAVVRGRLGNLIESGNTRLLELDHLLDRLSKEDWSFSGMRKRAEELRARAKSARAAALQRVDEIPGKALSAFAAAGRARVQGLARGLRWVEDRLPR